MKKDTICEMCEETIPDGESFITTDEDKLTVCAKCFVQELMPEQCEGFTEAQRTLISKSAKELRNDAEQWYNRIKGDAPAVRRAQIHLITTMNRYDCIQRM